MSDTNEEDILEGADDEDEANISIEAPFHETREGELYDIDFLVCSFCDQMLVIFKLVNFSTMLLIFVVQLLVCNS